MPALSAPAQHLLEQLHGAGSCPFIRLSHVAYGLPKSLMTHGERSRLHALLGGLERRGFIVVHRDWGTRGYGRPTWIEVTPHGAAAAETPGARTTRRGVPATASP